MTTEKKIGERTAKFTLSNFIHDSRSVGVLLILSTVVSLFISNLPSIGVAYHNFWYLEIYTLDRFHLPHNILHLINDILMSVFFFQVGMEIKRESILGELSSPRRMILPMVAAVSGVVFPTIIFLFVNKGTLYETGWAIPTATDIAFSLGVLSLLGKSISHGLKVFLMALAIIDDLCAILIIAFFYGKHPHFEYLIGVALSIIAIYFIIKHFEGVWGKIPFFVLGVIMWYSMYRSGVHASFAGVVLSVLLPIKQIPRYEKKLFFPVNFVIIPLFALANTSIIVDSSAIASLTSGLSIGIILGLFVGKPLGISLAVYLMSRMKLTRLGDGQNWRQLVGVGILAGIGFTMSIFISTLAFEENEVLQDTAKLSVLIASFLSMIIGYAWLKISASYPKEKIR